MKSHERTRQTICKKAYYIVSLLRERINKKSNVSSPLNRSNLAYTVFAYSSNSNQNMIDQLGRYYDLRYMQEYKRVKFLAGLSKYNEDEIVEKKEREAIESTKRRRKELEEFGIENSFVTENISQLLLKWYTDLTIRELAVCYMIIWTEWDMGTPFYSELILRIVSQFMKLFFSLKHIQDTIQGLIHKGIIIPMLCCDDKKLEPYIYLMLNPKLEEEGYKTISGQL